MEYPILGVIKKEFDGHVVRIITNLKTREFWFCLNDVSRWFKTSKLKDCYDFYVIDSHDIPGNFLTTRCKNQPYITSAGMYHLLLHHTSSNSLLFLNWAEDVCTRELQKYGCKDKISMKEKYDKAKKETPLIPCNCVKL